MALCNSLLTVYIKFVLGRVEGHDVRSESLLKHEEIADTKYLEHKKSLFENAIKASRYHRDDFVLVSGKALLGSNSAILESASQISDISSEAFR